MIVIGRSTHRRVAGLAALTLTSILVATGCLRDDLAVCKTALSETGGKLSDTRRELSQTSSQLEDRSDQLSRAVTELAEAEATIVELRSDLADVQSTTSTMREELAEAQRRLETLDELRLELGAESSVEVADRVAAMRAALQTARRRLRRREEYQDKIDDFRRKAKEVTSENGGKLEERSTSYGHAFHVYLGKQVLFGDADWRLSEQGKTALDDFVPLIEVFAKLAPKSDVLITGHTDSRAVGTIRGPRGHYIRDNRQLGLERALQVVQYLDEHLRDTPAAELGLNVSTAGAREPECGDEEPDESCHARNRRVELEFGLAVFSSRAAS